MEIETLNAMNEGMYVRLMMMIEVIRLITLIFAIAGFAVCLAAIAWFCFKETRQGITAPRVPATQLRTPFKHKGLHLLNIPTSQVTRSHDTVNNEV